MPDQSYLNPTVGLPDAKDFTLSNPYGNIITPMAVDASLRREQQMAPFMDMARKMEEMNLQNTSYKNNEYQSPWMQASRMEQARKQGLENKRYEGMTPGEIEKLTLGNVALGIKNASEGMDLAEKGRNQAELPFRELEAKVARTFAGLQSMPPAQRAKEYMRMLDELHGGISDPELQKRFRTEYGGDPNRSILKAQMAFNQGFHTPDYFKAIEQEKLKAASSERQARIHADATVSAARIREEGADRRAREALEQPKNEAGIMARARATLVDPAADPQKKLEAREIIRSAVEKQYVQELKANELPILQGKVTSEQVFNVVMKRNGLMPQDKPVEDIVTDTKGQKWKYKGSGDRNDQSNYERI